MNIENELNLILKIRCIFFFFQKFYKIWLCKILYILYSQISCNIYLMLNDYKMIHGETAHHTWPHDRLCFFNDNFQLTITFTIKIDICHFSRVCWVLWTFFWSFRSRYSWYSLLALLECISKIIWTFLTISWAVDGSVSNVYFLNSVPV